MSGELAPFAIGAGACALAALLLVRAAPTLAVLSLMTLALLSLAVISRAQSPDWPLSVSTQLWIYGLLPPFTALLAVYGFFRIHYKLALEWVGVALLALAALAYGYIAVLTLLIAAS